MWREDARGTCPLYLPDICEKKKKLKKQNNVKKNYILNHGPEGERDCSSQRQTQGQEKGHDGARRLRLVSWHLPADGEEE